MCVYFLFKKKIDQQRNKRDRENEIKKKNYKYLTHMSLNEWRYSGCWKERKSSKINKIKIGFFFLSFREKCKTFSLRFCILESKSDKWKNHQSMVSFYLNRKCKILNNWNWADFLYCLSTCYSIIQCDVKKNLSCECFVPLLSL